MDQFPSAPMDKPAKYRICVIGCPESGWVERMWGMTSMPIARAGEPEETLLEGNVADQAALIGIINALYNHGYTVVAVERMVPDA